MTKKLSQPRIRGVAPADRTIPDWYQKVYLRWAIRKSPRFRGYWATAARVLAHMEAPVTDDETMRFDLARVLTPDDEADSLDPRLLYPTGSRMPDEPPPSREFLLELERLAAGCGVGTMTPDGYRRYGQSIGRHLPEGDEIEPLRQRLFATVEPFLRAQMRADP